MSISHISLRLAGGIAVISIVAQFEQEIGQVKERLGHTRRTQHSSTNPTRVCLIQTKKKRTLISESKKDIVEFLTSIEV